MMLAFSLLGDQHLDRAPKADLVPKGPGSDEVEEKIGARHRASEYGRSAPPMTERNERKTSSFPTGIRDADASAHTASLTTGAATFAFCSGWTNSASSS